MSKRTLELSIVLGFGVAVFSIGIRAQDPSIVKEADPQLIGSADYKLPQSAIDAEIDGKVMIAIHVEKTGMPTKAVVGGGLIWPCDKMPVKELEEVSKTLSDTIMTLKFSPAIKDGKPVSKDIGLTLTLKNPKLSPTGAVVKDPVTAKPVPKHITAGVLNGTATFLPKPRYPAQAKVNRAGGVVPVEVTFDEKGDVIRAGATGGHPLLQIPARESACGAKFRPVTLEAKPLKVTGVITYNFVP